MDNLDIQFNFLIKLKNVRQRSQRLDVRPQP